MSRGKLPGLECRHGWIPRMENRCIQRKIWDRMSRWTKRKVLWRICFFFNPKLEGTNKRQGGKFSRKHVREETRMDGHTTIWRGAFILRMWSLYLYGGRSKSCSGTLNKESILNIDWQSWILDRSIGIADVEYCELQTCWYSLCNCECNKLRRAVNLQEVARKSCYRSTAACRKLAW